jgi:hypothetical protein
LETIRSGNKEFRDNTCYSEAVQAAIANLSDDDVIRSISAAGYVDILEAFELTVPEPAATEEPAEGEAAAE